MQTSVHINTKKTFNIFHLTLVHKYVSEEQHKMISTKILLNLCTNFNVYCEVPFYFYPTVSGLPL